MNVILIKPITDEPAGKYIDGRNTGIICNFLEQIAIPKTMAKLAAETLSYIYGL